MKLKSPWKIQLIATVVVIVAMIGLYWRLDSSPVCEALLMPGFFLASMVNGSFHDRVIPGYLWIGIAINVLLYALLANLLIRGWFRHPRNDRQ
jgi:hypothetical protein